MASIVNDIVADFLGRADKLDLFEFFDGTTSKSTPETGNSFADFVGTSTKLSIGLTAISGIIEKATDDGKGAVRNFYEMERDLKKVKIEQALEAAKQGETMTKLLEILPNIGTAVKRLNIEALWDEVADVLKKIDPEYDRLLEGLGAARTTTTKINEVSGEVFKVSGLASAIGTTMGFFLNESNEKAVKPTEKAAASTQSLEGTNAAFAENAFSEVDYRLGSVFTEVDERFDDLEQLAANLPDLEGIFDKLKDADALLGPISNIAQSLNGLVQPYEAFLDIANVIGAPIEGVLKIFESPPKILPTIVGYKTITPGFWDPVTTTLDPFDLLPDIWVPAVKVPIPGFKEIFSPIPRTEVQKIIDLVVSIAGIPADLLEKALSPLLKPLESKINELFQPIIDKINPFDDFLDDYINLGDLFEKIQVFFADVLSTIETMLDRLQDIDWTLNPIEIFADLLQGEMETFFGSDAAEKIAGVVSEESGGFLEGAVLYGNGGDDALTGTDEADFLNGGENDDVLIGLAGDDMLMGGAGDDEIDGGTGDDVILGDAGFDTAKFTEEDFADFVITRKDAGIQLARTNSDEVDFVQGIEVLQFKDQTVKVTDLFADIVTDPVVVPPADGMPSVVGGNLNDVLGSGPGRAAFMSGGGGADVFEFKSETRNGTKEIDVVEDFALNEDLIRLTQSEVAEVRQTGGGVMLILEDDGDAIYLRNDALDIQDLSAVIELA